jgi:MOSC domain-containing protein YiiM
VNPDPSHRTPIEILHLLVSPEHAYFGRPSEGAADVPTSDLDTARVVAGKGLVGDRFFARAAHMDAAVTLIAVEALEAVADALGVARFDPLLPRRNVVVRGAELGALLGREFAIEGPHGTVTFRAGRAAAPCAWMDRVLAPGAHAALRGRGGLRCAVLTDGVLARGPAVLVSDVPLDPALAGEPTARPRLP